MMIMSEFLADYNLWDMDKVDFPLEILSNRVCIFCSFSISKAEVASSNIKMVGSFTAILAMAMRCFCPPEKLDPLKPTNLSKPFLILFYSYLKVYDDSGSSALTTVSFYILSFSISEFSLTLSSSLRMNLVALARSAALRIYSSEASGRP